MAKETNSFLFQQMRGALALSCWTEDLDLGDYTALADAVRAKDFDAVEKLSSELLGKAIVEWESLGRPATPVQLRREKWGIA